MATTEHNLAAESGPWGHPATDEFLIIPGEEATTKTGHRLTLGIEAGEVIDWNHQVGDGLIDQCLDQVHRVGGLCVAAHPHAPCPSGDFMFPFRGFDVVEVWNGLRCPRSTGYLGRAASQDNDHHDLLRRRERDRVGPTPRLTYPPMRPGGFTGSSRSSRGR